MAWNEPGNNNNGNNDKGPDKNPWGNNGDRGGKEQGPPDIDQVFKNLSQKLGGKFSKNGNNGSGGSPFGAFGLGVIVLIGAAIWGVSGFYTIEEAERGVVLRLGKYDRMVDPGLNWLPRFVDKVIPINEQMIRFTKTEGLMLTKDENVVTVDMTVQYRIADSYKYLYQVTNADDSLRQATDSALRAVIGDSLMDSILTSGREEIRQKTEETLNQIIDKYDMGIAIVDVNFQSSRPPEQVKRAFDDAITAREDEARFIRMAEAYKNEILPQATGRAERVKKEAQGYKERVVNEALGQVAQFEKLLPEYQLAKEVTRERLYLDTMEKIYSKSSKVLIDSDSSGNMLYLPIDKLISQSQTNTSQSTNTVSTTPSTPLETSTSSNATSTENSNRATSTRQGRF